VSELPWGFLLLLPLAIWVYLGKAGWLREIGPSRELLLFFILLFFAGNFFTFNFILDGKNIFVNLGGYIIPALFAVWLFFRIEDKRPLRRFFGALVLAGLYLLQHNFELMDAEWLYPLAGAYPLIAGIFAAALGGGRAAALFAVFAGSVLGQSVQTVIWGGTPFYNVRQFGTVQDLNLLLLAAMFSQAFCLAAARLKKAVKRKTLSLAPAGDGLTKDGQ